MAARTKHHALFKGAWRGRALPWLLGASLLGVAPPVAAHEAGPPAVMRAEIDDLAGAIEAAKAARMGASQGRVLLVLDIDNTLLTMPQYLGGDRWFNHHVSRIAAGTDPDFADVSALIAAQTALFGLASMEPTQPGIPELLSEARAAGVDVFLLSARGPDLYDATRRELDRNAIRFDAPYACAFFLCTGNGVYGDREIRAALAAIGENPPASPYRNILIRDGVMLVAGQDKGVMLKLLMAAIGGRGYAGVVVADDGQRNIDALAASGNPVPLSLFHYRRIDTAVTAAEDREAQARLRALRAVLCPALQTAFCPQHRPVRRGAGK